jgi:hypothetical protein
MLPVSWCRIELRKECCLGWSTWFLQTVYIGLTNAVPGVRHDEGAIRVGGFDR